MFKKKGGRVVKPMRYFNPEYTSHYHSENYSLGPHAEGNSHAISHGKYINNNLLGPDLGVSPVTQKGGSIFSYIINPKTNRKVLANGKKGRYCCT